MNTELAASFNARCKSPSDINQHLVALSNYAEQCRSIVEFGVRDGNSTIALLNGIEAAPLGGVLHSFDIAPNRAHVPPLSANTQWHFTQADTGKLETIPPCDLLFIDTLHTRNHVTAELKHAELVRRWIAFHDTTLFGDRGERGEEGITSAIYDFLARSDAWRVERHWSNNNGLLVLCRR